MMKRLLVLVVQVVVLLHACVHICMHVYESAQLLFFARPLDSFLSNF